MLAGIITKFNALIINNMHEFSIATRVIEIAMEEIKAYPAARVETIELEVGTLSGVIFPALETAMEAAVKDTPFEHGQVKINRVQAKGRCKECNAEFKVNNLYDPCPSCNELGVMIISGKELKISSITVQENEDKNS